MDAFILFYFFFIDLVLTRFETSCDIFIRDAFKFLIYPRFFFFFLLLSYFSFQK